MNGVGELTDKQLAQPQSQFEFRCDVHPWMKAVAGTFKHDYHTLSAANGAATLKSVPPGEWTVRRARALRQEGNEGEGRRQGRGHRLQSPILRRVR
jgi:hypothetical protein